MNPDRIPSTCDSPEDILPGLERIRYLVRAWSIPLANFRTVLVAGTNGKGSTAAMLAALLRVHGLRTGLYLSPHLTAPNERIQTPEGTIPEDTLASLWSRAVKLGKRGVREGLIAQEPTYFEVMTACALKAFSNQAVDVAVLEVGMGGRWDATNVVEPDVSILTSVGRDHQQFLGRRIQAIALEKFGIARPGRPFLCGVGQGYLRTLLRRRAAEQNLHWVDLTRHPAVQSSRHDHGRYVFECRDPAHPVPPVPLGLPGRHQRINAVAAETAAALIVKSAGLDWSPKAVADALASVHLPGRLERLVRSGGPDVLLDGAHNRQAAGALVSYLGEHAPGPWTVLFGCLKDKPWRSMLRLIRPFARRLILVPVPYPERTWTPGTITRASRMFQTAKAPDWRSALESRLEDRAGTGILVTGSFYLVGAVRAYLISQGYGPDTAGRGDIAFSPRRANN